ncbi:hypothetical protein SLS54_008955 [Diplodia seriata]
MLCGVKTQFLDDPHIASIATNNQGTPNNHYLLHIVKKRIYMLQAQDGTDIALINTQAAGALHHLDHGNLARYSAYVSASEWTEKIRSFRTKGKSVCLEIDLYIFGEASLATSVGRILSNAGLFLQTPDFLDSSMRYDNPHEVKFASFANSNPVPYVPTFELSSMSDLSADVVNKMLSDLDHVDQLTAVDVDTNMIITELKPWEHTVLGYKRKESPNESFGGIIADEMGLGKTLMTIAAICMSLGRAQVFSDGDGRQRTRRRTKATLVICPAVLLMDNWAAEILKHTASGLLKCTRYHGASKSSTTELIESDIVMTTYATLMADSTRNGVLHGIQWFRIVLDEAHSIRHQNTKQFRAIQALSANHRWCLTGTPIQNAIDDLGALVRFLRVPDMEHSSTFRTYISGPIEEHAEAGVQRLRALLQCICLRRTKNLITELSDPNERMETVQLTEQERAAYDWIGVEYKQAFDEALAGSNPTAAHRVFFTAIMRQRIFCNSGLLSSAISRASPTGDEELSLLEQGDGAQTERQDAIMDVAPTGLQGHSTKLEAVARNILLHSTEKW